MADGTTFEIDIDVPSGGVSAAAAAVARLNTQLDGAKSAAMAAAQAVNAGQAAYAAAEAAANKTALAVERIGLQATAQQGKLQKALDAGDAGGITRATNAIEALNARQATAQTKAASAAAAMNAEAASLDRLKAASSAAEAAEKDLTKQSDAAAKAAKSAGDGLKSTGKGAEDSDVNLRALSGALGKLGGPLGSIGQTVAGMGGAFQKLGKTLGDAGPYVALAVVAAALAAAIAAAAIAAVAATVKMAAWAVSLQDAARSQGLLSAGIAKSVSGGALLNDKIDSLLDTVPQTREELMALAKPLADSGLQGKALTDALENSAIAASKLKLGPEWAKEMNSIPNQTARMQRGFEDIFKGLKIEPLLSALSRVTDLFQKNSATANAAHVVFLSLFQPLINGVTAFIPKMVTAFIQFEILVMKALIAIKPFYNQIVLAAEIIGVLAAAILGGLAIAIGAVIVGIGLMAIGIGLVIAVITAVVAGIVYASVAFYEFGASIIGGVGAAFEWLKGLSLAQIGSDLIDGLVNGIASAGPKVLAAIKGIAGGAISAAIGVLKIGSPSKVFAELGGFTAAGMQQGIEGGTDGVQGAMTDMVDPSAAAGTATGAAPAAGAKAGGGAGITINNLTLTASNPGALLEELRAALQDLLTQGGGGAPAGAT